jgi:hypothetical protein
MSPDPSQELPPTPLEPHDSPAASRDGARRILALTPVIVGCLLYVVMALDGVAHDSGTYDEYVHVTAGYSYWAFNDYRLNPENGNLAQRIIALPLAIRPAAARVFPTRDQRAWHVSDVWGLADQFFFGPGHDADTLLFAARVPVAIVGALLGALVFFWARGLFGTAGAYVSFVLYVFSPTMLAHGGLATSDMIGAAFFIASLFALWTVLHRITLLTLAASVVAVGGLFLAKPSAPLFIPVGLALIAVQLAGRRPIALRIGRRRDLESRASRAGAIALVMVAHIAVAYALIWAAYGFRYRPFAPGSAAADTFIDSWSSMLETPGLSTSLARWGRTHHVLPEAYLYGFATVVAYSRERIAFLNGVVTLGGSRVFFPYAALVKTTLAGLVLLVAALVSYVGAWRRRNAAGDDAARRLFYELTPLLLGVAIYGWSALSSSLNIGYRHLLPIIPLVMILTGIVGPVVIGLSRDRRMLAAAATAALLLWHAGESLAVAPHYLAYFNAFAGGPSKGYRHLVDSSLDWGQDLPSLKDWLDAHGLQGPNHPPVFLSYFGTALPSYYRIDAISLPSFEDRWTPRHPVPLTPGVYCFSATMLQSVYYMAPGRWNQGYENAYRSALANLARFDSTATDSAARRALVEETGEPFWVKNFQMVEQLRTARLAAHLRRREPDDEVGYSILIYRVNQGELSRALLGPSPQ